jgi:RNA polymerase sigma-70 factor (ECF subfamily)
MDSSSSLYQRIIEPIEDRMIRSIWRITRNAHDAEDAMQNALMAIWKRQHRISQHPSPQALVLRICIDAACDVARRRARDRNRDRLEADPHGPAELLLDSAPMPWEDLAHQELSCEILSAINQLSRRQAVAITLRVFEELPYEQIAAAMDCTEATARKHVERARGHLRVVLAKYEPHRTTRS